MSDIIRHGVAEALLRRHKQTLSELPIGGSIEVPFGKEEIKLKRHSEDVIDIFLPYSIRLDHITD